MPSETRREDGWNRRHGCSAGFRWWKHGRMEPCSLHFDAGHYLLVRRISLDVFYGAGDEPVPFSPRKGCNEPFDANDVAPALEGTTHAKSLVQVSSLATHSYILRHSHRSTSVPQMPEHTLQGLQVGLARQYVWFHGILLNRALIVNYLNIIPELTCEEYQALPLNERAPEDLAFTELAKKEKWRRCPKVCS